MGGGGGRRGGRRERAEVRDTAALERREGRSRMAQRSNRQEIANSCEGGGGEGGLGGRGRGRLSIWSASNLCVRLIVP